MALTNELFSAVLKKAGIDYENNEALVALIQDPKLNVDISSLLPATLITREDAKKDPELGAHYRATILDPIDKAFEGIDLGVTKNSFEKAKKAAELIKNATKTQSEPNKETEVYKQELERLNNQLAEKEANLAKVNQEFQQTLKTFKEEMVLKDAMSKVAWSDAISEDLREVTFKQALNIELNNLGGKIVFDDNNKPKVVRKDAETLSLVDKSNKSITFDDLVNTAASKHKLVKVAPAVVESGIIESEATAKKIPTTMDEILAMVEKNKTVRY